jgi:hypothetical protein
MSFRIGKRVHFYIPGVCGFSSIKYPSGKGHRQEVQVKTYTNEAYGLEARWESVEEPRHNFVVSGRLNISCYKATEEDADAEWASRVEFLEGFWASKIERYKAGEVFVANGNCYADSGNSSANRSYLGFGGARWRYTINGKVKETNNLWCGGDVPSGLRDVLLDNATLEAL